MRNLAALSDSIILHLVQNPPWTNVYGLGRSLIALGTLMTLVVNEPRIVFRPALGITEVPLCGTKVGSISLFCIGDEWPEVARWSAILVLVLVATGWRPRLTGILHWWVSFSFFSSAMIKDGGDQAASVITLLLIPITLTDRRRWHWESAPVDGPGPVARIFAGLAVSVIRLQIAVIYLHAAVGKTVVEEWRDGTAVYYWFTHPVFGSPEWLDSVIHPLVHSRILVTALSWGTICFEFLLFLALALPRERRAPLLLLGVLFHSAIALVHGLPSFSLIMAGALVLYILDARVDLPILHERQFVYSRRRSARIV